MSLVNDGSFMAQFMAKKKALKAAAAAAAAAASSEKQEEDAAVTRNESDAKRRRTDTAGDGDGGTTGGQKEQLGAPPPLPPAPTPAGSIQRETHSAARPSPPGMAPPAGRPPGMAPPAGQPPAPFASGTSGGRNSGQSMMMDALRRIQEKKLALAASGGVSRAAGNAAAYVAPHAVGYTDNTNTPSYGGNQQPGLCFDFQKEEIEERLKYTTGDDVEEGMTLDQLKRKAEMARTEERARQLTAMSKRKHHIGDYIPEEDLERFLEKADAITTGRTADLSDYKNYTIMEDNIGHKMLQKAGWKKGTGLGADEQGRLKPVDRDPTAQNDTVGIGITNPTEVKADDDALMQYRKRMSLGYRNRPNPLNNPRRSYGGYNSTGMN